MNANQELARQKAADAIYDLERSARRAVAAFDRAGLDTDKLRYVQRLIREVEL